MPSTTSVKAELLGNRLAIMKLKRNLSADFAATAGIVELQENLRAFVQLPELSHLVKGPDFSHLFRTPDMSHLFKSPDMSHLFAGPRFESPLAQVAKTISEAWGPHFEKMTEVQAFAAKLRESVDAQFLGTSVDHVGPLYDLMRDLAAESTVESTVDQAADRRAVRWTPPRPLKPEEVLKLVEAVLALAVGVTWVRSQDLRDVMLDTSIALLAVLVIYLVLDGGDD